MAIESLIGVDQNSNIIEDYPQFTNMEGSDFGPGHVNNVSRSNSEVAVDNYQNKRRNYGMGMQRGSMSNIADNRNASMQRGRPIDPFDMFVQLKRQQNQKLQMGNNGENGPLNTMDSFQRVNTLGSFANMGSLSKLSSSDMSLVLSAQEPVNGKNNQSWGNPMNSMNERMHSSLPIMNSPSYSRMDTGSRNNSMTGLNCGRSPNKFNRNSSFGNFRSNNQQGSNDFMNRSFADDPYAHSGNPFLNNNGGNQNSFNGGNNFNNNNNSTPLMTPSDMSKLSNEQLQQMILMESLGNNSAPNVVSAEPVRSNPRTTNISNSDHSASSNPFLKNLGIMNYRNHVMPMSIERHSNKSKQSEELNMVSTHSDMTTSGHNSMNMEFNQSSSNFSFADETYGTMPDEKESYNAAANGILAPWSARAAGLFGDMMIQSSEDEKARKAARKKPKDKPKRPLSAYNIFFKEERNRILTAQKNGVDVEAEGVPVTISIGENLDKEADDDGEDGKDKKKKIGFESLAKLIGRRWQELDDESMAVYKSKASVDMERYKREMEVWDAKHGTTSSRKRKAASAANKKSKMASSSAHESSSSNDEPAPLSRRNSTGGSIDLSTSGKHEVELEPDAHSSLRDLSKARSICFD